MYISTYTSFVISCLYKVLNDFTYFAGFASLSYNLKGKDSILDLGNAG